LELPRSGFGRPGILTSAALPGYCRARQAGAVEKGINRNAQIGKLKEV